MHSEEVDLLDVVFQCSLIVLNELPQSVVSFGFALESAVAKSKGFPPNLPADITQLIATEHLDFLAALRCNYMFRLLSHALGDRAVGDKKLGEVMKSLGTNPALTRKMIDLDRKCGAQVDPGVYSAAWGAVATDILQKGDFSVDDIIAVNVTVKTVADGDDTQSGGTSNATSSAQGKATQTQTHVVSFRKLVEFSESHIELDESLKGKSEMNVFAADVLSTLQLAIQSDMLTTARQLE